MPSPGSRSRRRASCWAIERLETRAVPATIIVNSAADTIGVNGLVTLREAITSINDGSPVNADVVAGGTYGTDDTVEFNIPGQFPVIKITGSGLPIVRRKIFIDGAPQIQLDGDLTNFGASGLTFNNVVGGAIRGLDIVRFNAGPNVAGITIIGGSANWIEENIIGINAAGSPGSPGQLRNRTGVSIQNSSGNFVYNNVISGNTEGDGVTVDGNTNEVMANHIGTDLLGLLAAPNLTGVDIAGGTGNIVGENLISGNDDTGILVVASDTEIYGNMIGTNTTGARALPNTHDGIDVVITATGTDVDGNQIAGNGGHGIVVDGANNTITDNQIGTDSTGLSALPNAADGVLLRIRAVNNAVSFNTIAFNGQIGVAVTGAGSTGNVIQQNSTFANGALGIDLGANGVTPNEPNNPLNFPVLIQVEVGTELTLVGVSPVGATIELFVADPDPSGFGQGKTFIATFVEGSSNDLDPSLGGFRFVIPLPAGVAVGTLMTATSTTAAGTSEFSANVAATALPPPVIPPVIPPIEPPPVEPPLVTVVSLHRFGFHMQPTHLVLIFSNSLDVASAQDLANYKLTVLVRGRHVMLHIKSATYDQASLTVTLKPKQLLPLKFTYNLKVSGVLDGLLRPVVPFMQTFGRSVLAGPTRV
jgi:Right handed beta helix region